MGLYLCVFKDDDELEGVEVGAYSDFALFRDTVTQLLESGVPGSRFPVLINHSDCDGEWSPAEAKLLFLELKEIGDSFTQMPAVLLTEQWKINVAAKHNLKFESLYDCFFDVDGEPLIERFFQLIVASIKNNEPIVFQ